MTSSSPGSELDLRGERCPYTFVRTRLALEELPLGTVLHVLLDSEPASRNVPKSVTEWGQEISQIRSPEPGTWLITIRKTRD